MALPLEVKLVEVGPRDGLQNEATVVPTSVKTALIDRLSQSGLKVIEIGAFVSPRAVPQMADTAAVMANIMRRDGVSYPVLTPNMKGFEAVIAAGAKEVAVFAAASETFSRTNINCSIAASLKRYTAICKAAQARGVAVRGYVSCALGCPYEGELPFSAVVEVAAGLHEMGCYEVSLGDTIGIGTPNRARALVRAVAGRVPVEHLAAHFHDTYGQALANLLAVMEEGAATIDSSIAGLGGCPFAPGASGNVASEDVIYMLNGLDVATGVGLEVVVEAGRAICEALGREPASKVTKALAGQSLRGRSGNARGAPGAVSQSGPRR